MTQNSSANCKNMSVRFTNKNCATTLQTNKVKKLERKTHFSKKAANSQTIHYVIRTLYKWQVPCAHTKTATENSAQK